MDKKIVVAIIKNGNRKETVYQDNVHVRTNPGKTIPIFIGKYCISITIQKCI